MGVPNEYLTMAEIARTAEVRPAAVSNWRRRYPETFPAPQISEGKELFAAASVASWLDKRTVAANDLKDGEATGTTYGARFRRNLQLPEAHPDALAALITRHVSKHRGLTGLTRYEDLILGLLYLRQQYPVRWRWLRSTAPDLTLDLTGLLSSDRSLTLLEDAVTSVLTETGGQRRLMDLVYLLDSVLPSIDQDGSRALGDWPGDVFGQVLDYFADSRGRGSAIHTPPSVVRALMKLVSPQPGDRISDPFCENGSFLVEATRQVRDSGHEASTVSLSGRVPVARSWSLATMNLTLHGLQADLDTRPGVAIADRARQQLFDVVVTNPPFNMSDWGVVESADPRWRYGIPPAGNANFAWLQHIVWSLHDQGRAAVIMPNGASSTAGDREIRARMVEAGVVEAIIALPAQLFASTAIPVSVWLLRPEPAFSIKELLFVDARAMGSKVSRSRRELSEADIHSISSTVEKWRRRKEQDIFADQLGFTASVQIEAIREQDYSLVPGRYIGAPDETPDAAGTAIQIHELREHLAHLHAQSAVVDAIVDQHLARFEP